jgi:hypothetical protein
VLTEDWRWRMVTPAKGDFAGIPVNAAGRTAGLAWDPAKDEAESTQCKAYGAPGLMRLPTRLHVTWQDDSTLKLETDYGSQTRLFHFGGAPPADGERTWQGYTVANWEQPVHGPNLPESFPIGLLPRMGTGARSLEAVTTQLRPGYLRKNGVPYGASTLVREYFDVTKESNGDTWLVVTTIVQDPEFLRQPLVTSSNFKKERDGSKWAPTPCSAR